MKKWNGQFRGIDFRPAIRAILLLLLLTMICGFLARYLSGSETLEDYANKNPEIAYGNTETADETVTSDKTATSGEIVTSDQSATSGEIVTSDQSATSDAYMSDVANNNSGNKNQETETSMNDQPQQISPSRVTYEPGFYYEELSDAIKARITGISYPEEGGEITYDDLRYLGLLYFDFDGNEQEGELICNKSIAQDLIEIFYELYRNEYQIEQVRLVDEYGGDDTLSMLDNNTSCFNYRVVDGTTNLSKHAYGLAIDINPFYNPYIVFNKDGTGETYISPKGSEVYADRSKEFAYKIDENDLCYKLFTQHGFTWGGNWNNTKDYQHFQKTQVSDSTTP